SCQKFRNDRQGDYRMQMLALGIKHTLTLHVVRHGNPKLSSAPEKYAPVEYRDRALHNCGGHARCKSHHLANPAPCTRRSPSDQSSQSEHEQMNFVCEADQDSPRRE